MSPERGWFCHANMIASGSVDNLANQQSIIRVSAMIAAP
jgi:hypothetical protein